MRVPLRRTREVRAWNHGLSRGWPLRARLRPRLERRLGRAPKRRLRELQELRDDRGAPRLYVWPVRAKNKSLTFYQLKKIIPVDEHCRIKFGKRKWTLKSDFAWADGTFAIEKCSNLGVKSIRISIHEPNRSKPRPLKGEFPYRFQAIELSTQTVMALCKWLLEDT